MPERKTISNTFTVNTIDDSIRLDLDNQADIVAVDSDGKVRFARTVTVKARIYNGGTLQTSGISLPTSASSYMSALAIGGVTPVIYHTSINNSNKITGSTTSVTGGVLFIVWTFAKSTQMSANTAWEKTIQLKYSNVTYDAAFSLTSSDTDAVYQLKPNKNELAFSVDANNAYTPSELRVKCGYIKDTGSGVTAYEWPSSPTAGKVDDKYWILYRRIDASGVPVPTFSGAQTEGWNWTYGTVSGERTGGEIIIPNTSTNSAVEFCLSPKGAETTTNSDIIDIESIPIVRSGKAGTSPFLADLDNEMGGVACDSSGATTSEQYIETNAKLFKGTTAQTLKSSGGVVCSIAGYPLSNNYTSDPSPSSTYKAVISGLGTATANIKVYVKSGTVVENVDIKVTLTDTNNVSRDATLTMVGVKSGAAGSPAVIYNLKPSASEVSVGRTDAGAYNPSTFTLRCGYTKNVGGQPITTVDDVTGRIDSTYNIYFSKRQRSNQSWTNYYLYQTYKNDSMNRQAVTLTNVEVATYDQVQFVLSTGTDNTYSDITTTTIIDKETVPIVSDGRKGNDGTNGDTPVNVWTWNIDPDTPPTISGTSYPPSGWETYAPNNPKWAVVQRNSFTTANWNTYGAIGYNAGSWTGSSSVRGNVKTGNWFTITGKATDANKYHVLFYRATNNSGDLTGVCMAHYTLDTSDFENYLWQCTTTKHTPASGSPTYDTWANPFRVNGESSESWRIAWYYKSTESNEIHTIASNDDYSCSLASTEEVGFKLQHIVNGVWTDSTDYYVAVRGFNASGTIVLGWNSTGKGRGTTLSSSGWINPASCRYYVGYLCKAAETSGTTSAVTASNIFMSSRISKVPAGDDSYYVSTNPQVIYIETDSSGKVTDTTNHTIYVPFFKGNASSSTNGTISSATCSSDAINIVSTGSDYSRRINGISGKTLSSPVNVAFTATAYGVTRTTNLIVIPNKKGANGNDAIHIDLDNENDAIQYMGGSNLTGSVTSQARLYGATETISIDRSTSTIGEDYCSIDSGLITVYDVKDSDDQNILSGIVVVKARVNQVDYFATFTVQRLDNGQPKYEIEIDSPVIIGNMDAASASVTVGVKVYRTAINTTTNLLERSLVSDLSAYNLKLWRRASTATNPTDYTTSYSSGWDMTINVKGISTSITDYTLYLTKDNVSAANAKTNYYDIEKIPVQRVYNGSQGEKGDAARQPYEWGKWSDFIANNSNTFVANKYEAPYFIKEEEVTSKGAKKISESKWLWVGADGTFVPPSATPATGQSKSTAPSNDDGNWTSIVTNFKYLISEAQIADYGKFGAGIFSKDYAFSQYGLIDGGSSDHYKNFRPEFFKGQPYVMFEGSKSISTTSYPSGTPFEFGKIFLDVGLTYTFTLTSNNNISSSKAHLKLVNADTGASFRDWYASGSSTTYTITRSETMTSSNGNKEYAIQVYSTSGSFNVTKIEISVNKAFKPNLYIDWLKGEIYSQLGRFVNVTVEGVLNNLSIDINETNYSNYGSRSGSGQTFWLNPTKVGNIVTYNCNSPLGLPSAWFDDGPDVYQISSGGVSITLNELRQCIGKKIYLYTFDNTSMQSFYCGENGNGMFVYETGYNTIEQITSATPETVKYNRVYQYVSQQSMNNSFFILECKLGEYSGHECIYWGITRSAFRMDYAST